jgi:hypothetical protein
MPRAPWTIGLATLLLAAGPALGQQCPPSGTLNLGLIVDVHGVPASGGFPSALAGATVCLAQVIAGEPEFGTLAFNISLLPARTTGSSGYACFDFRLPARAVGRLHGDFRGTIVVRTHKDGYCADEITIAYEGTAHRHLRPKEIPSNSIESAWCGSLAGLRCNIATPSPFREPLPQASPELLHQAPMPAATLGPDPIAPIDPQPHETMTPPPQRR